MIRQFAGFRHFAIAELLAQRFEKACRRLGLNTERGGLDTTRFRPAQLAGQMALF